MGVAASPGPAARLGRPMPRNAAARAARAPAGARTDGGRPPTCAFDEYHAEVYGHERWYASIRPALARPLRHCGMHLPYTQHAHAAVDDAAVVSTRNVVTPARTPVRSALIETASTRAADVMENPYDSYVLDLASVAVAHALRATPGERVLDMCSAPGGKALALAAAMFPWRQWVERDVAPAKGDDDDDGAGSEGGGLDDCDDDGPPQSQPSEPPFPRSALTLSEASSERRQRLTRTLRDHLPERLFHWRNVRVADNVNDAAEWGHKAPSAFDRVLLDAPCTGERHLVLSAAKQQRDAVLPLVDWSVARCRRDAERQMKLLVSALRAVRVGGVVVYATCSICPAENDAVVRKVLSRIAPAGEVEVRKDDAAAAAAAAPADALAELPDVASVPQACAWLVARSEPTPCGGRIALPDRCDGFGPLFWCRSRSRR